MIKNIKDLLRWYESENLDQLNERRSKYGGEVYISSQVMTTTRKVCFMIIPCIPGLRVKWRFLNGKWQDVNEYSPAEILEYASVDSNYLIKGSKTLAEIQKVNPEIQGNKIVLDVAFRDRPGIVLSGENCELGSLVYPFSVNTLSKALDQAEEEYSYLQEEWAAMADPEDYYCTDRK